MASGESPSSLPFPSLTELADALPATEPAEQVNPDVLCDIEDPILFQAVLTRLKSMLDKDEWRENAEKLTSLSPRSFIVALAAGEFTLEHLNTKRLRWMLHGPNPYILTRPTMMHEVRALILDGMRSFPSLHHLTSLRKLNWTSESSLPNNAFSRLRQHVTGLRELLVVTERLTAPMLNDIARMMNLESSVLCAYYCSVVPPLGNLRGLKKLIIYDLGFRQGQEALVLPSTLEGLTSVERLVLKVKMSDDLAAMIPNMFPILEELRICRRGVSQNALASLKSHYGNKEGFKLDISY